jgi:hypothetical protein
MIGKPRPKLRFLVLQSLYAVGLAHLLAEHFEITDVEPDILLVEVTFVNDDTVKAAKADSCGKLVVIGPPDVGDPHGRSHSSYGRPARSAPDWRPWPVETSFWRAKASNPLSRYVREAWHERRRHHSRGRAKAQEGRRRKREVGRQARESGEQASWA